MTEFQFRIEDLRLWAPPEAEVLQWPDRVPIYDNHNTATDHGAFLTGHRYVYTLPHVVEEALKRGGGEILPHFEGLPDNVESDQPSRQRLSYLFFNEFNSTADF